MKSIKERGLFKQIIKNILFTSDDVMKVLLDNCEHLTAKQKREVFLDRVKSHLFIDDTLTEKGTYIFYDIVVPNVAPQIKECNIIMYLVSHRELLDDFGMNGFYGNRADALSQAVEGALLNTRNAKQFGIGDLQLTSVDIYNSSDYYGVQMIFKADCFR